MTKRYELFKFFNFAILIKRQYNNSVILGSYNELSKKLNLSYYLTKRYINFGLKIGLIHKLPNGFKIASYDNLITKLGLADKIENYSFYKIGNLQELIIKNSFIIALHNFKAQEFKIKEKKKILSIKNRIATGQRISKADYSKSKKECANFLSSIVTGQKHLNKILGFSQNTCFNLLKIWHSFGFISRKVVYSNNIDPFNTSYILRLDKGNHISLGSKIVLNPLVVTKI